MPLRKILSNFGNPDSILKKYSNEIGKMEHEIAKKRAIKQPKSKDSPHLKSVGSNDNLGTVGKRSHHNKS